MTLPANAAERSEEEEGRIDAGLMLAAFERIATALNPLSQAERVRVIRAALALNGLTHEDLES